MARRQYAGWALAAGFVATVSLAVATVSVRHADAASARPLPPAARAALSEAAPLVGRLAEALREVPRAASDLTAGTNPPLATRAIAAAPALAPLTAAIAHPAVFVRPLLDAFEAARAGRPTPYTAEEVGELMDRLQTVEGDAVPAARLVAAQAGRSMSAATVLTVLESDRHAAALAATLRGWPEIYGALTVVVQATVQTE